jgi:hypothetical protein
MSEPKQSTLSEYPPSQQPFNEDPHPTTSEPNPSSFRSQKRQASEGTSCSVQALQPASHTLPRWPRIDGGLWRPRTAIAAWLVQFGGVACRKCAQVTKVNVATQKNSVVAPQPNHTTQASVLTPIPPRPSLFLTPSLPPFLHSFARLTPLVL